MYFLLMWKLKRMEIVFHHNVIEINIKIEKNE